jgi:hypothetical protein
MAMVSSKVATIMRAQGGADRIKYFLENVDCALTQNISQNYEVKISNVPRTLPGPLGARTFGT